MKYSYATTWCVALLLSSFTLAGANAAPTTVRVTVENLAPQGGTYLTPPWIAFHDGDFDIYNVGAAVGSDSLPAGLESIAEDGMTEAISGEFASSQAAGTEGTLPGPIPPGESRSMVFTVDGDTQANRYMSFVSMVIPSNDAFIANGNPKAHPIFDSDGNFVGADFTVQGSDVLDAGTEVNDETPENTAFFGQMTPNTGMDEDGVVGTHPGYMAAGSGGILDDEMFAHAGFKAPGYQVARITVVTQSEDVTTISTVNGGPIVAPNSISSAWGFGFTEETTAAESLPLPTSLGGVELNIVDSGENRAAAGLYMTSADQINFLVPEDTLLGKGMVTVTGAGNERSGDIFVSNVAPALITVNAMGAGLAAGQAVSVSGGSQTVADTLDAVSLSDANTDVYLTLYGTGIRRHSANPVQALINGVKAPVLYAGEQSEFPGLDQVNIGPIPSSLAGAGAVDIEVFVDGVPANVVTATFQ